MGNNNFGYFGGTQAKRILILGESHHWLPTDKNKSSEENAKKEREYKTECVIKNYLQKYQNGEYDSCYEFFEKIISAFGFDVNDRARFWNNVYFKNYISDHLCGVENNTAQKLANENRNKYNDELFSFINEVRITTVFVFSRLVYNSLPSCSSPKEKCINCDDGTLTVKGKRDYISHCTYLCGIRHDHSNVLLDHDVEIIGVRHPSARGGFCPENYCGILNGIYKESLNS